MGGVGREGGVAAGPRPRAALGRAAPAPLRQARLNAGPLSGLLALLPYRPPRRPSFIPRRKEAPPGQPRLSCSGRTCRRPGTPGTQNYHFLWHLFAGRKGGQIF